MSNAVPVEIPHPLAGGRYVIDFDALKRAVTPRTRLLIYTSPSNPLGWVATEEEQQRLLDFYAAPRPVADGRRGVRAACTSAPRGWASRRRRFSAWRRATTR